MKVYLFLLFVCLNLQCLNAQVKPELTLTQLQEDFDKLRSAMEEAHGGLYRFSTKAEMDKRFDAYRKRLATITTQKQFILLLSELLADTRDGHMRLDVDEATGTAVNKARLFPFRLQVHDSRLVVLYNETPADATIKPGMEILSINGRKAADLIQSMFPYLPADGYIKTGKLRRLDRSFPQYYWLVIDTTATFTITAKDDGGKTITTKVDGVVNTNREANRNNNAVNREILANMRKLDGSAENISLQFLNDGTIAHLRIRTFGGQDFRDKLDSVFKTVQDKKTPTFILDLRGNGGGVDEYGAFLVSQFVNKPFRYFDRIHLNTITPSFTTFNESTIENLRSGVTPDPNGGFLVTPKLHSGVGEQQPGKYPFLGKLFVLMDGGTFSTAADVTALLRHLTKAIFIGEESGGGYEGNTSGLNAQLKLPNSKLGLRVQMSEYFNAVTPAEKGRGTIPDYIIVNPLSGWLYGVDAHLRAAIELSKK